MDNRKIDQLVAEKVMGWKEEKSAATTFWVGNQSEWRIKHLWKPTENMDDAWDVVEKLRKPYSFALHDIWDSDNIYYYNAEFSLQGPSHFELFSSHDKSAPLAICKAALKTAGVEV